MGENEKKVVFKGKSLSIKAVNLSHKTELKPVQDFIRQFNNPQTYLEIQTSGSTGAPKTIRLPKEHMKASALKTLRFLKVKPGDRALLCLPTDKVGGLMMLMRWWVGKLDLHIVEPQSRPLENLVGNFDFAAMVPYQASQSLDQLGCIQKLIIGGGPVPPDLETKLREKRTGEVWHTYGMTETISHVAMRRLNAGGSDHFKAMDGVHFDIDERNCLVIHSPDIGVKNLITNDVVELLSPHEFKWLGRYDNVVNSGGVKLFPEAIEAKMGGWDYPFFLAGKPDKDLGHKLVMLVETARAIKKEEVKHLFQKLTPYEIPKEIINLARFEYTSNGKLNRPETLLKI